MKHKKIIFIVGPTAVGKTDAALYLAKKLQAEIISCDAMQVYREINIASNKPSQQALKMIPHHLVDIISVKEEFDAAAFNARALEAMRDIHRRGKTPVFTGGSGMYVEILLDGIFPGGPKDVELRRQLAKRIELEGNQGVYEELKKIDPQAAQKIHPHDAKRIIRALEVYTMTGKPISQWQKTRQGLWGNYDIHLFALNRHRADLYARINQRVEDMFAAGLVDEIRKLTKTRLSATARSLIGIEETLKALNGQYDLERAKYLIKLHTRHYAKRQLTWLRREKRSRWIMIGEKQSAREIAQQILDELMKEPVTF